jgi:3-phosphoglycerate kinase
MDKMTVADFNFAGKTVFVRTDFNVPLDDNQNISDDTRIKAALPTIKYILDKKGKVVVASHLGRPGGQIKEEYRLTPVAERLEKLLGKKVTKLNDCVGNQVRETVRNQKSDEVILLENLRFHMQEKANDDNFAKELASLADVYVNDAFGTCHREHASIVGIPKYIPGLAGFLLEKEIKFLSKATKEPKKPYVVILGGAKVSDKLGVIENLADSADRILIGGGMCYTFLKAKGIEVGSSILEEDKIDVAKRTLEKAKEKNVKIVLPVDHVITKKIEKDAQSKTIEEANIPDGWVGADIGPKTIENFKENLQDAKMIIWNGPLGVFEIDQFKKGTEEIAVYISQLEAETILGGGDTASAVSTLGLEDKMTHISTGGGASLTFLEGSKLPGIEVLASK